uniref:RNase III domain-containing protein n=1 Tax=Bionectria ochroleuca TaxID=29856 RepID=A0A0B7K3H7_BIOOC
MTKRDLPESPIQSSKRLRTSADDTGALLQLIENAEELTHCLQSLTEWKDGISRNNGQIQTNPSFVRVREQLAGLSKKLSPIFQQLDPSQDAHHSEVKTVSDAESPVKKSQKDTGNMVACPPPLLAAWHVSEIPSQLPPLPKINDSRIEIQSFRHPGMANISRGELSYERLDFPNLPVGKCSQIREQLIRNMTLAEYFRSYNLMQRAQIPPSVQSNLQPGKGRSADKDLVKVQADMFEAYVAAIIITNPQDGVMQASSWLRGLFSRTIKDQIVKSEITAPPIITEPKQKLAQLIGAKGVEISYEDMPTQKKHKQLNIPMFAIGVYLTGWGEQHKLLGIGTATGKKEAGNKAAIVALENRKLMKVYEQKKKAFVEAQAQAQPDLPS